MSPPLALDRLAGQVAVRSVLQQVQALAAQAPGLSDQALRARLRTALITLDQHART